MTVTDTTLRNDYVGAGNTDEYDWTFPVESTADLAVYTTAVGGSPVQLALGVDFTASQNTDLTGTITLTAGDLATGVKLAILPNDAITQTTTFSAASYRGSPHMRALDKLTMLVRQLKEDTRHAIRAPLAENWDGTLPSAINRANKWVGFDISGNLQLNDAPSGGSGSGSSSGGIGYNVKDTEFGAIGDGLSHPLSAEAAAVYNTTFGSYGLSVSAGDEQDYAAIQAALYKAANTGEQVYAPPGTYRINKPLSLIWTATPITGQPSVPLVCKFYGAGRSTVLKGYNIATGRGVVEMLGESNAYAANIEIADMQVEEDPATCHKYSYCLRLGDGYVGINLRRVICKGAQALSLRVASSSSYAQIAFVADQCQFWSNWNLGWGPDDVTMDVYCIQNESLGAYWDMASFNDCFFWGSVNPRAFVLKFNTCMFINQVERATSICCSIYLGTASFDSCYFEDYLVGIASTSITASVPVTNITVRGCHFSTANNSGTPAHVQSPIQCAADQAPHGPVLIENCRFGSTATYSDIDLYGAHESLTVTLSGNCRPFGTEISTPPTITTAGDVRIINSSPDKNAAYNTVEYTGTRIKCPDQIGPITAHQPTTGQATVGIKNTNTGNGATAAVFAETDNNSARLIAYGQHHASLPNYVVVMSAVSGGPVALGVGGLLRFIADETWSRATKSVDGGYGLCAENTNAGTSALAFSYVTNGTDFGGMILYGTGHALAGQMAAGTTSAKKFHLMAGGVFELTIDPTTNRVSVGDYGVVGGRWMREVADTVVDNTTTETSLNTGGVGVNTLPANTARIGSNVDLEINFYEEAVGAVNYTFRFYIGTNSASASSTFGGAGAALKTIRFKATFRTIGATATIAYTILIDGVPSVSGTFAADTTGALPVYASVQPSVAASGNRITSSQYTLDFTR